MTEGAKEKRERVGICRERKRGENEIRKGENMRVARNFIFQRLKRERERGLVK